MGRGTKIHLFEEIEDGFGRPEDGDGSPPPLPPKNPKGPPTIMGGNFMKIACFADDARDPTQIGETNVDLTEVLTKGETDGTFIRFPAFLPLTILQNGLRCPPRASMLEKYIWS
jgi:hypothetical protein